MPSWNVVLTGLDNPDSVSLAAGVDRRQRPGRAVEPNVVAEPWRIDRIPC
jgi:hypothetical protein